MFRREQLYRQPEVADRRGRGASGQAESLQAAMRQGATREEIMVARSARSPDEIARHRSGGTP